MVYVRAYSPYYLFQNGVNLLRRFALQEKQLDERSLFDIVEISLVDWHASYQPL